MKNAIWLLPDMDSTGNWSLIYSYCDVSKFDEFIIDIAAETWSFFNLGTSLDRFHSKKI